MAFKPTDLSGCVWWLSPQGDPYATTSTNPGGCFLDTSNTQSCKDGDYVRQVKDLSSVADHAGVSTAWRQPVYRRGGRHGPFLRLVPIDRQYDADVNPIRARIVGISAATGTQDIYTNNGFNIATVGGAKAHYLFGLDSGWMHLTTPDATTDFNWSASDTVAWTATGGVAKTATYTGVAEGMQYLEGSASRAVSSAGGISVYVAMRSRHTSEGGAKATWFSHDPTDDVGPPPVVRNFAFGCFPDGNNSPKLNCFINGNQRACTTLSPSHSPQIYSVRADNTSCIFSMGDLTETVANAVSVSTNSAVFRAGQFTPLSSSSWYGAGDYYAVIVFNRKLNNTEHAQVLAHLRAVTDIQEYSGLLTLAGYSIWSGFNSDQTFWEMLDVERLGYEVRVNALPDITQSQIRTNILAATGTQAFTAPYVNQSNYRSGRKYAILAGLTNDYANSPGDVSAAMTALKASIAALQGQGHKVIVTTDVDKYTGTSQWRTDADTGNPLIRQLGLPVIDFAANTRLGVDGAARNQQFFYAGYVHPNASGHRLMAAEAETVLFKGANTTSTSAGMATGGVFGGRLARA